MPEYLAPGVYVEEIELGPKPIEGVSTSTAGFLGEAERGPTNPRLVTSWLDYQRHFGSFFGADKYLPYAVQGFFSNGGKRCYIARIVRSNEVAPAVTASLKLEDGDGGNALTLQAVGEGEWGNRIYVKVSAATFNTETKPLFRLTAHYWKKLPEVIFDPDEDPKSLPRPAWSETFDNLSVDVDSPDYYEKRVNGASSLFTLDKIGTDTGLLPAVLADLTPLADGDDGEGDLTKADFERSTTEEPDRKGLNGLNAIDGISLIYSPNAFVVPGLVGALIAHCENHKYRFAIIDSAQASPSPAEVNPRNDFDTKYAAFYYPWLRIIDGESGLERIVPPGGHVAGIYARSDIERGVHKAPANEAVRSIIGLQYKINKGEQEVLNPRGVNVIRAFPDRGRRVWGARTLSSDPLWKYVNVRRLFIFLEESIDKATQWVVFEPNNEDLWARVKQTITRFLVDVWRTGALMGTTPDEAFFVKVDRSTMTQNDIDNGRLIVLIGVAPTKPAEFVIFRIAQFTAEANA